MTDLPPPNTKRWVVRRKAAVLAAIRSGEISVDEACRRYGLSEEEVQSWQRAFDTYGLPGLRATRLPASRNRRLRRGKPRG
jgi:transposase